MFSCLARKDASIFFKRFYSLWVRRNLLHTSQDFEEAMQLFPEVANDRSGEAFRRFRISCKLASREVQQLIIALRIS